MLARRNKVKKKRRMGRPKNQLLLDGSLGIFENLNAKKRYMFILLVRDLSMWSNWYKFQEFIKQYGMEYCKTEISNMVGATQKARYERNEMRKAKYGRGSLFQFIRNLAHRVRAILLEMGVDRNIFVQLFKGKSLTVRMSGLNYKDLNASTDITLYVPIVEKKDDLYSFMTDRTMNGLVRYQGNLEVTVPIKNLVDLIEFRKDGSIHRSQGHKEWVDLKQVRR
jgi:hypothetical protein